jgi:hypothetical protein
MVKHGYSPTDGTRPHWVRVEPNQTRTHILKSDPPPAPAPAPAPSPSYTFCPIPTPAQVKKPVGNTHPGTTQQDNIISQHISKISAYIFIIYSIK